MTPNIAQPLTPPARLHPWGTFDPNQALPDTVSWQHSTARELIQWGFHVGPLDGKRPLVRGGFHSFTTDRNQIDVWWRKWPNANVGARPNPGVLVIDIDPRNGGLDTWRSIVAGRVIPQTSVTKTGGGGLHYWFTYDHSKPVRSTAGGGIDIKTDKGYLVMPASVHPTTHKVYEWGHLQVPEPARLPSWLEDHVYKPPQPHVPNPTLVFLPGKASAALVNAVLEAQPGERNNVLYWAACRNVTENLGIDDKLTAAARHIGLSDTEITTTLTSARLTAQGGAA